MGRYLFEVSYSTEGLNGVAKAGAASRIGVVEALAASVGGSSVSFDFAFGDTDVYAIVDLPDDESAAAIALTVAASGAVSKFNTVKLLTADQVDAALAKHPDYTPPGA
jgi:uncharacterized protein with GYD domain